MFETAKDNHNEYSPWSYNLLGGTSVSKTILEDDDGQDLNNSMVDDLVAKILDDDCITARDIFTSPCNGSVEPRQIGATMGQDSKTRLSTNAYLANTNSSHQTYSQTRVGDGSLSMNENDLNYRNICSGLNSLDLNFFIEEQNHCKGSSIKNGYINNVQRAPHTSDNIQQLRQQYPVRIMNDGSISTFRNSYTPLSNSGLTTTTTNCLNYNPEPINWSDTLLNNECAKDLFGHYSKLQSCNNTDYNLNAAAKFTIDSPKNGSLNEMQLHCNIPPNSHSSSTLNVNDSYNMTANGQAYRPSSIVTDLNINSSFLTNSSLPHFSPVESLRNYYANASQHSKYEEYKDYHETSNLSVSNIITTNEQLYQKRQQQHQNSRACKFDDVTALLAEHAYKPLVNQYSNLPEMQKFVSNNDMDSSNGMPLIDQKLDTTLLKILNSEGSNSGGGKSREEQVFSPIGYSRNLATAAAAAAAAREVKQLQQLKFNYQSTNDCQRFIVNNADAFKAIKHQNSQINHKRSNNISHAYKMKVAGDLSNNMKFISSNALTQQQQQQQHLVNSNNSVENDFFNRIVKQRQQQRIKNLTAIPSTADVLFNAGIIQNANAGVFSTHTVMPIPVAVPPSISMFEGGLGYRNNNSARRSGPSRILYSRLEQTYEQFKQLEKERKKCEAGLAAHFPGKKVTSANNISIPRLQGSPSRVDKLIIDHYREHARVITLITKMERLRGAEMNQRIHKAMDHWRDAIKLVQERRKQEIANTNKRQKENLHCISIHDDSDIQTLADSIYKLTKASRFARTAMFNAMQATLLYDAEIEVKIVEANQDIVVLLQSRQDDANDKIKNSGFAGTIGAVSAVHEETTDRT